MAKVKIETGKQRKKILPLVMALGSKIIDELGVVDKINESVKWDSERWNVSPGRLAKILILSTFSDVRVVLSHIQERFDNIDLGYLIGEEGETKDINAFNVGRALERIGEADHDGIYEQLALSAIEKYEIPVNRTHSDTTTVSFYGEYDVEKMELTEEEKEELLHIEKGYNKDGKPGCKQVIVGQVVNEEGIPLISRVLDGTTTDVEWNKEAIKYMTELQGSGFNTGIYVADSKLVTEGLIREMRAGEKDIQFVSRCPASFNDKLESRMIEKAYEENNWEDIGRFHKGEKASSYRGITYIETVYEQPMRLLVLESTGLVEKAKIAVEKAKDKLRLSIKGIEKKEFACEEDVEKEMERFKSMKGSKLFDCAYEIEEKITEKWPRGRRKADTKPKIQKSYRIKVLDIKNNAEAVLSFMRRESSIVLISNVIEGLTDRELLGTYKGQQVVENSFRYLKGPNMASVIYLKNPVRIQALTMLLTFSLLVRAIIQFRLRKGLKAYKENNPDEKVCVGWGGKELKNPTFKLFYEHAVHCYYERETPGEYSFAWPNAKAKQMVMPLLGFLGLTIESIMS